MNLDAVRAGEETFDAFAKRTMSEWQALAAYICRRVAPWAMEHLEDVVQELLFECWQHVPKWDPARGSELTRYCVFGSVAQVTRRVKGRKAERRKGMNRGNDPLALAEVRYRVALPGEPTRWGGTVEAASVESAVYARRVFEQALKRCTRNEARRAVAIVVETADSTAAVERFRAEGMGKRRARRVVRAARENLKAAYA